MRLTSSRAAALLLSGAFSLPAVASSPVPGDRWQTLDTPNFRILSEARASDTKRVARRLETLRACIDSIGGGAISQSPARLEVVVFRSARTFEPYRGDAFGNKEVVGFFTELAGRNWTAVNLDAPGDPFSVVYHEYLHAVTFRNFPQAPLWFHEGVAEFYSTFESRDEAVDLGRPVQEHVAFLRQHGIPPLEEVLTVTSDSEDYNENDRAGGVYATSWLLTHYILTGDSDRRGRLPDYIHRVGLGESPETAFAAAFGKTLEAFREDLRAYLGRPSLPFLKITFRELEVPEVGEPTPAVRSDASVRLGMLAATTSRADWSFAESHFREFAASDPPVPGALAGIGFIRTHQAKYGEAEQWFDRALSASPDDPEFQRLAAANLLLKAGESLSEVPAGSEPTEPPAEVLRARELLARSLATDEDNEFSITQYGQTFLLEPPEKSDPGIAALEKARRLGPRNVEAVLGLAQLRARRGEVDAARELVEHHLAKIAGPEDLQAGRRIVILAGYEEVRATAAAGDLAASLEKARALRQSVSDAQLATMLDEGIRRLETVIRQKNDVDEYNAAVEHARAGRIEEARTIWKRLAAEATDAELRQAAAEALGSTRSSKP